MALCALSSSLACAQKAPAGNTAGTGGTAAAGGGGSGGASQLGTGGQGGVAPAGGSEGRSSSGGASGGVGGVSGVSGGPSGGAGGASGGAGRAAGGAGGASGGAGQSTGGAAGRGGAGTTGADIAVLTNRSDNARSGANLRETILTTANVKSSRFGLLFSRQVDGQMYAQPLYVGGLTMSDQKVHNVVYLATEHNTVYAFDADDSAQSQPLWSLNVGPSGSNGCDNLSPEVGITATPVIDLSAGVIELVSKGEEAGAWVQRIHAVDLVTGKERPGSPAVLAASVKGTGAGAAGGNVAFNPGTELNRASLLLVDGVVYAAFASHCDAGAYHGWILGYRYDGTKFTQVLAFNDSANGSQGGIWQAGTGLSSDGQSIFVAAGNGSTNPTSSPIGSPIDLSESVFRLGIADGSVQDYWIPTAYASLNQADADLSAGAILLPHNLLMTGSKDGRLYVLDSTNLGKFNGGGDKILQTLTTPGRTSGARGHVHGGPIHLALADGTEKVFIWPEDSPLMAYTLDAATRKLGALVSDPIRSPSFTPGHPGAILALSANGNLAGTAILWAALPTQNGQDGAWHTTSAGAFYAIDAADVTNVLWSDSGGSWNFAKFTPPLVANGHVYLPTFSGALRVYGLN